MRLFCSDGRKRVYPVSLWTRFQILVGFATPGIWTLLMDDMAGSKWLSVIGNSR
jgi:hypothetical protein